jgi:hypothetical protein
MLVQEDSRFRVENMPLPKGQETDGIIAAESTNGTYKTQTSA